VADEAPKGTLRTTPPAALAVAVLFGALAGWMVVVVAESFDVVPPRVPWSTPIGLALIGGLVGALAWTTHQRIQVRKERMEPQRAVTMLVLGKASALGGAFVVGGYLAFGLLFLGRVEAETPRERVIRASVAVVAGAALTVAGLLLERACKVPGGGEDEDDDLFEDDTAR
jgi:ABC-type Fe3+-siderophore transport system permease subunit